MRAAGDRASLQTGIAALKNTAMDVLNKNRSLAQGLRHYRTHALKLTGNNVIEQKLRPILHAPVVGPTLHKRAMLIVRKTVNSDIEGAVSKVLGQREKGWLPICLKRELKERHLS